MTAREFAQKHGHDLTDIDRRVALRGLYPLRQRDLTPSAREELERVIDALLD